MVYRCLVYFILPNVALCSPVGDLIQRAFSFSPHHNLDGGSEALLQGAQEQDAFGDMSMLQLDIAVQQENKDTADAIMTSPHSTSLREHHVVPRGQIGNIGNVWWMVKFVLVFLVFVVGLAVAKTRGNQRLLVIIFASDVALNAYLVIASAKSEDAELSEYVTKAARIVIARLALMVLLSFSAVAVGGGFRSTAKAEAILKSVGEGAGTETNDERNVRLDRTILAEATSSRDPSAQWRSDAIVVILYIVMVAFMVGTALLIVQGSQTPLFNCTLSVSILLMNIEFFLVKEVVTQVTAPDTKMIPAFHEYPLAWKEAAGFAKCNTCNQKLSEKGKYGLQSTVCLPNQWGGGGYNVCAECYKKYLIAQEVGGGGGTPAQTGILVTDDGYAVPGEFTVKTFIVRMLGCMLPFKLTVFVALFCTAIQAYLISYMATLQGLAITDLSVTSATLTGNAKFKSDILRLASATVLIILVSGLQSLTISMTMIRLYNHMAKQLYTAMIQQDMVFYDVAMSGQLTSRLNNDLSGCTMPVPNMITSLLGNFLGLCTGLYFALTSSWQLSLLAFVFLSPVVFVTSVYADFAAKLQAQLLSIYADANGMATQALQSIKTVTFLGGVPIELRKYDEQMENLLANGVRTSLAGCGYGVITTFMTYGSTFMVLYFGGLLVLDGDMNVGSIITFQALWSQVSGAFKGIAQNISNPVKAASSAKRVFEIIDLQPVIKDDPNGKPMPDGIRLKFENVHFHYYNRPDVKVFRGLNFEVEAGKTTAFVGKSGCGKSTLTRLLLRYYNPRQGTIYNGDTPLPDMSLAAYRSAIGLVSQETQLFKMSIRDNLTYGLEEEGATIEDEEIHKYAQLARAHEFIQNLPQGYATMCGENAQDLSGGQRQRISIARALLRKPKLLLLDEATSALDAQSEKEVQDSLDKVMIEMQGKCTIVSIAHRLASFINADKICMLHNPEKEVYSFKVLESSSGIPDGWRLPDKYEAQAHESEIEGLLDASEAAKLAFPYAVQKESLKGKCIITEPQNYEDLRKNIICKVTLEKSGAEVAECGTHQELLRGSRGYYKNLIENQLVKEDGEKGVSAIPASDKRAAIKACGPAMRLMLRDASETCDFITIAHKPHRQPDEPNTDVVAVIREGEVVEVGTHQELYANEESRYSKMIHKLPKEMPHSDLDDSSEILRRALSTSSRIEDGENATSSPSTEVTKTMDNLRRGRIQRQFSRISTN